LILVLAFGNAAFHDWAYKQNAHSVAGLFWQTLAWPTWRFSTSASIQNLLADDLKAVLLIVFAYVFVALLTSGVSAKGSLFLSSWAGYIFAGAVAGLVAAWLQEHATLYTALVWAIGGAAYGLIVGWIVGLVIVVVKR
jgi:hypothetical protein